jgi:hypothetical protein
MSYVDDAFANLKASSRSRTPRASSRSGATRRSAITSSSEWELEDDFLTGSYRRHTDGVVIPHPRLPGR